MALNIQDIKTKLGGFFQRKLKNLITLGNDSTLESDLKPIKVGDDNTPIEISETEVRVSGTIKADAIVGPLTDVSDVTLDAGRNIILNTAGLLEFHFTDSGYARFRFFDSSFIIFDSTSDPDLDYFKIAVNEDGETTISTDDHAFGGSHSEAHLTIAPDGDLILGSGYGQIKMALHTSEGLLLYKSTNSTDYAQIVAGTNGDIVFSTVDANAEAAHLTLDPDGDLIITTDPNTGQVTIDKDTTNTATATNTAMQIDLDHTGISASGQTITNVGLDLDINCESVTHIGTVNQTGIDIDMVAATDGTQTNTGINIKTTGADKNVGLLIDSSATHIKLVANADPDNDYALFTLADTGDLTIATVGSGGTDSDLTLDADGDLTLDAAGGDVIFNNNGTYFGKIDMGTGSKFQINANLNYNIHLNTTGTGNIILTSADNITIDAADALTIDTDGTFIMKKDGTEFSAANSAYAGMILAYTCLLNDAADDSYSVTDAYAVPDAGMKIVFVAPPSGNVEIFASIYAKSTATRQLEFGLSDNATYNTLDVTHEHEVWIGDETDEDQLNHQWVITGLTAGTSYTYFLGAKSGQTGRITLHWGGDATGEYAPFIMKATALPATLYTG